jgi:hypothetical protein
MTATDPEQAAILAEKHYGLSSAFTPESMLRCEIDEP